jgi:PrtD family type I secretion system ABC transporter
LVFSALYRFYRTRLFWVFAFALVANALALASPVFMLQVYDRVLSSRSIPTLGTLLAMALVCHLTVSLLDIACNNILASIAADFERRTGAELARILIRDTASGSGDTSAATVRDAQQVSQFISGTGLKNLLDLPWFPLFLAVIFLMSPPLGWMALVGALVLGALAIWNRLALDRHVTAANTGTRRAGQIHDMMLRNAEAIQGLGMVGAVVTRWRVAGDHALAGQVAAGEVNARFAAAIKFCRYALQSLMLAAGAWLVIEAQSSPGIMIASTIILARVLAPIEQLVANWKSTVDTRISWARLTRTLAGARASAVRTKLPEPAGDLQAEGVGMDLPQGGGVVLRQVSFRIPAGASLAVTGLSGAGKSSLMRLLAGIGAPTRGHLRLDGASLADWDDAQRTSFVGYLPQTVELLPGTVAENIARFGAATSDEVVAAARLARCHEMILRLPGGYEMQVGDRAEKLAPGQRQRIGLARALCGPVRVAVLDEPDANLDGPGEAALRECLRELARRRVTVVFVSHRSSMIRMADRLLVLRNGSVEAFGPREAVLERLAAEAKEARRPQAGPVAISDAVDG